MPGDNLVLVQPGLAHTMGGKPPIWNALQWDAIAQYWAWRQVAHEEWHSGRIPLWNTYQACGAPLLANPQVGVFYPLNLCFWLLNPLTGFSVSALMHTFLALLFTYLLCRGLGMQTATAITGAAVYAFASFFVTWEELPTLRDTATYLPLLLFLVNKILTHPSRIWLVAAAITVALMLLAGHPQVGIYALLVAAIYSVLRVARLFRIQARHSQQAAQSQTNQLNKFNKFNKLNKFFVFKRLGLICAALALGFSLASAQLLPALELSHFSHRAGKATWDGYLWFSLRGLQGLDMTMLLFPYALGRPQEGTYIGKENFADYCPYTGFGALLLTFYAFAIYAFAGSWRRQQLLPTPLNQARTDFALLALFCLLLAMGTPLNLPLYFLLPGFSQLGTPTRILFAFQLAVGVLTAIGMEAFVRSVRTDYKPSLTLRSLWLVTGILLLTALIACVYLVSFLRGASQQTPPLGAIVGWLIEQNSGVALAGLLPILLTLCLRERIRTPLTVILCAFIVVSELWWFGLGYNKTLKISDWKQRPNVEQARRGEPPTRILPLSEGWSLYRLPPALLPPNTSALLGYADVQAYDSLLLAHYKALMKAIAGEDPSPPENGNMVLLRNAELPLLPLVGVERVLARRKLESSALKLVGSGDAFFIYVYRAKQPQMENQTPRIQIAHQVQWVERGSQALDFLRSGRWQPAHAVVILHSPLVSVPHPTPSPTLPLQGGRKESGLRRPSSLVLNFRDFRSRLRFDLKTDEPTVVVIKDTFYPGWQALACKQLPSFPSLPLQKEGMQSRSGRVEILRLHILPCQYALRALIVAKGSWRVEMVYLPTSYRLGLYLSLLSLGLVASLLASYVYKKCICSPCSEVTFTSYTS